MWVVFEQASQNKFSELIVRETMSACVVNACVHTIAREKKCTFKQKPNRFSKLFKQKQETLNK